MKWTLISFVMVAVGNFGSVDRKSAEATSAASYLFSTYVDIYKTIGIFPQKSYGWVAIFNSHTGNILKVQCDKHYSIGRSLMNGPKTNSTEWETLFWFTPVPIMNSNKGYVSIGASCFSCIGSGDPENHLFTGDEVWLQSYTHQYYINELSDGHISFVNAHSGYCITATDDEAQAYLDACSTALRPYQGWRICDATFRKCWPEV